MNEWGGAAPTERFTDRAASYAASRPSYPGAAIGWTLEGFGAPDPVRVVDIGAGTGISSRLYADRGCAVTAVEPNAAMRAVAAPHERVTWVEATGEATGLDAGAADLVVCAQAMHWLSLDAALTEFRRVLRPGGRLALLWNVPDETHGPSRAYREVMRAHAVEAPRSLWVAGLPEALPAHTAFTGWRTRSFPCEQRLTKDALLGRAASASYFPKEGASGVEARRAVEELFAANAAVEVFTLAYRCEAHLATRA